MCTAKGGMQMCKWGTLILPYSHTLTLSHSHTLILSYSHTFTLHTLSSYLCRKPSESMCYDISFTVKLKELPAYFPELETSLQLELDFDGVHIMGHSFNRHPIIYRDRESKSLTVRPMEWGVIPFYIRDENSFLRQRASMLNTRSERILADEKSYWYKIRNRRCLIPVN